MEVREGMSSRSRLTSALHGDRAIPLNSHWFVYPPFAWTCFRRRSGDGFVGGAVSGWIAFDVADEGFYLGVEIVEDCWSSAGDSIAY